MKFNPQWLEKCSLVTVRRKVKNKKTNTLILTFFTNFKTSSNLLHIMSVNSFKHSLNIFWKNQPVKFQASYYRPETWLEFKSIKKRIKEADAYEDFEGTGNR